MLALHSLWDRRPRAVDVVTRGPAVDALDLAIAAVRKDLPDPEELAQELKQVDTNTRRELVDAFKRDYLTGIGPIRTPKEADEVAELMGQNVTAHALQFRRLYEDVSSDDVRAVTAANLALAAWLRSFQIPESLVEVFTHLEGQTVARAFLIGLWHAHEGTVHSRGLLYGLKAKRVAATLPEGQARAQADNLRGYLLDLGLASEVAAAATSMVAEHSFGAVNRELQAIQKAVASRYQRDLDLFFACLSERMKAFLPKRTVEAMMVLVQHAAFRALLAGYRLGALS